MKALAGFLVAAAMLMVLGGVSPAQASSTLSTPQTLAASFSAPNDDIATILADTNVQRANAGLVPLVLSEQMTRVAQEWSVAQAAANAMSHNPNYSSQISSGWTRAGENVARGYQPSTVVSAWMASSGHRANILGNFNTIGIGYVNGYFTQVFALYPNFSDDADGVTRIAGRDRYATSAAISVDQFTPGVETVYLASGESFPDALSAAAAAGAAGVPVLLTRATVLPSEIISELARLRPEKIVVLGGENTISDSVLHAAEAYATDGVTRIAGRDRYATSAAISVDQFTPGVETVYLASGESFPDALSAAAAAGAAAGGAGVPVLLTRATVLPSEIISELARLRPEKIVVLGGENTISDSVLHAAEAYATDGVTRIAGRDRYATSAAISVDQFTPGVETVYLASGESFPDALSAAAAAGAAAGGAGVPVLLTRATVLPSEIISELARLRPEKIVVLGGENTISDSVLTGIAAFLQD